MFSINNIPVAIERYPDNTPRINIPLAEITDKNITLSWLYEKDEEMLLFFIARHLKSNFPYRKLILHMPYIPHARMDRVKNNTEVFTLKYFCDFINSLNFDKVIVRDAHSSVSLALLNNVYSEPIEDNIKNLINNLFSSATNGSEQITPYGGSATTEQNTAHWAVFYPDEGSMKRYSEMINFPYAFGIKKRDWKTGKITGLDVMGELPEKPFNVLIIDDISSYGGTFYHSAKKLKELGADKIFLYITHCENSILNGELINSGLVDKIYTTKSIFTGSHPLINFIEDIEKGDV